MAGELSPSDRATRSREPAPCRKWEIVRIMTNATRIELIRDKLSPCQIALGMLLGALDGRDMPRALDAAQTLVEAFLDLEAATGAPVTPQALYG